MTVFTCNSLETNRLHGISDQTLGRYWVGIKNQVFEIKEVNCLALRRGAAKKRGRKMQVLSRMWLKTNQIQN
jgi:hypothetical protein